MSTTTASRNVSSVPLLSPVVSAVTRVGKLLAQVLYTIAFWAGAFLPVAYLPLVFTGTLSLVGGPFLALLALHGSSLLLGHNHTPRKR